MPIYDYRCLLCKEKFEMFKSFAAPVPDCPKCGHKGTQRLISRPNFSLKGDGWFKDHYGLKKPIKESP